MTASVVAAGLAFTPISFAQLGAGISSAATVPCGEAGGRCNGATALLLGGRGQYAQLTTEQMLTAFGGYFAEYNERVSVPFPGDAEFAVSVPEGSDNLYDAIYAHQATAGTPLTIGGVSKGAPSVVDVLYRLMADAENTQDGITAPTRDQMNVAIYGAPGKMFFIGTKYQPIPETPYDILIVAAEYDGIADFPDNPFNLLAVLNAVRGAELLHVDAAFYDVANNPVHYRTDTNSLGATTTTVIVPAARLPLLNDMYESDVFDPKFTAFLEKALRPVIDSAYKRNWASQQKYWKFEIPTNLPGPPGPTGDATLAAPQAAVTGEAPPDRFTDDSGEKKTKRSGGSDGADRRQITSEDTAPAGLDDLTEGDFAGDPTDRDHGGVDEVGDDARSVDAEEGTAKEPSGDDTEATDDDEPAGAPSGSVTDKES
ncbi:PE-PPE domain-containing protein [Mycolicibacterium sp. BiH015]|uniref:PE-PPE domain-containing protein n=1 Tax=Mycolicibacterium sp. BiH015 TaxID=3018808 RepID=UPI0022E8F9E3|nr:PE-PPE domain-containing protein [Mycolicibacterium sp. BiH015]MDA2891065.1 PE-PPE domain-containing protein [Mycolicibacterium sp. BiH015]